MKIIEDLIYDYSLAVNRVEKCLSAMLNQVTRGHVPSKDDVITLETEINELRRVYESITLLAEVAEHSQIPDDGVSAADFADASIQSEMLRLKEQLAILNRNLSIP